MKLGPGAKIEIYLILLAFNYTLLVIAFHVGTVGCSTGNATESAAGIVTCPGTSTVGIILLAFYMMMSNVLLLNLLIAMFRSEVISCCDVCWGNKLSAYYSGKYKCLMQCLILFCHK